MSYNDLLYARLVEDPQGALPDFDPGAWSFNRLMCWLLTPKKRPEPVSDQVFVRKTPIRRMLDRLWFNKRHLTEEVMEQQALDDQLLTDYDDGPIEEDVEPLIRRVVSIQSHKTVTRMRQLGDDFEVLAEFGEGKDREYRISCDEAITNGSGKITKLRRRKAYADKLLMKLKNKFPFDLTDRTRVNIAIVQRYAVQCMSEQNLRTVDQRLLLSTVVERFFIPDRFDNLAHSYRNTSSNIDASRRYHEDRFVFNWYQRYFGCFLPGTVRVPSAQ